VYLAGVPKAGKPREVAMAKSQMRSTKDKKKPKAESAKKKKSAPAPLSSPAVSTKKA
jgi:hypothetical protein